MHHENHNLIALLLGKLKHYNKYAIDFHNFELLIIMLITIYESELNLNLVDALRSLKL